MTLAGASRRKATPRLSAWAPAILFLLLLPLLPGHAVLATDDITLMVGADPDAPDNPVVIAYPDSGINPYHVEFRAPAWQAHPSTYIPGYALDAKPLHLTLDAASYDEAIEADEEVWDSIVPGQLYYVPGTRIVGGIVLNAAGPGDWLDRSGHGTGVASRGSGSQGTAPESAIVALRLVALSGEMRWLADASWIDVVSDSHGDVGHVGVPPIHTPISVNGEPVQVDSVAAASWQVRSEGRFFVDSAGNGLPATAIYNQLDSRSGPPWVMTVGGLEGNGTPAEPYRICETCSRPFELAARYRAMVADHDTLGGFHETIGTSYSAPSVAGYAARLVAAAREVLADPGDVGDGYLARLGPGGQRPAAGPLSDGALDADEVERGLQLAAEQFPVVVGYQVTPGTSPTLPFPPSHRYLYEGYGAFDDAQYLRAEAWLQGEAVLPERLNDDRWHDTFEAAAWAYWGTWMCNWNHGVQGLAPCVADGLAPPGVRAGVPG